MFFLSYRDPGLDGDSDYSASLEKTALLQLSCGSFRIIEVNFNANPYNNDIYPPSLFPGAGGGDWKQEGLGLNEQTGDISRLI